MAKLALIEWKEEGEEEEPITEEGDSQQSNFDAHSLVSHPLFGVGRKGKNYFLLSFLPPPSGNHRRRRRLPIRGVADSPLLKEINFFWKWEAASFLYFFLGGGWN